MYLEPYYRHFSTKRSVLDYFSYIEELLREHSKVLKNVAYRMLREFSIIILLLGDRKEYVILLRRRRSFLSGA